MFEKLLGVELPVSITVARAELRIEDVLRMTAGSVIELNKAVGEKVDLLVHGMTVARGEVVSAKGNYAILISEIVDRGDRLKVCHGGELTPTSLAHR